VPAGYEAAGGMLFREDHIPSEEDSCTFREAARLTPVHMDPGHRWCHTFNTARS
jgi:hypothetical protein